MSMKSTPWRRRLRRRFASSHSNDIGLCRPRNRRYQASLGSLGKEAVDAVGAGLALDLAPPDQVMRVCDGLAESEGGLVPVEVAAEQYRQQIDRAGRPV